MRIAFMDCTMVYSLMGDIGDLYLKNPFGIDVISSKLYLTTLLLIIGLRLL